MPGPVSAIHEAGQIVTLTAVSNNPALVPNPTISGSGSTHTLTFTPGANKNGTATITVTANDGQSANNTFARKFTVTVNPVDDADLAISMTESTSPAGRLRDLTYTINILNNGPDTADKVTVSAAIPVGAIFKSSSLTPLSNDGKKITWSLGSIAAGVKTSITMAVFVSSTAPDLLVSFAQVSTIAQEPSLANNSVTRSAPVVNVGTFAVTAPPSVEPGEHFPLTLDWTVPGGRWRELSTVDLRIRDEEGTLLWVRFDEAANTLSLFNPHSGKFGPGFAPGSANELSNEWGTVYLKGTSVLAAGPTSPTVRLTLDLSFKHHAAGRELWVEVAATDDLGNSQGFDFAAVLESELKQKRKQHSCD
jgi:uncharacterized repeat protein (TIGR01451 family)